MGNGVGDLPGRGGDAAEAAGEVQRHPRGREDGAGLAGDSEELVTRRDPVAVGLVPGDMQGRVDQLEGDAGGVEARRHTRLAGAHHRRRLGAGRDHRVRGDITGAAQILQQGSADGGFQHQARER